MKQFTPAVSDVRCGFHIRDMTIGGVLKRQADRYGERRFLMAVPSGETLSYAEVDAASDHMAAGLRGQRIRRGDMVAVLMENSLTTIILFFALAKVGATNVPLNTAIRGKQFAYQLSQADCTTLIVDEALLDRFHDIHADTPAITRLLIAGEARGDTLTWREGLAPTRLADMHCDTAQVPEGEEPRFSDLAFIFYTSGTTGPSKGCMFSHARCLTGAAGHVELQQIDENDLRYVTLPVFHTNATVGSLFPALLSGGAMAIAQRFSVSRFWADVRQSGATVTNLLGSMMNFLWAAEPRQDDSDNSLRLIICAPIPTFFEEFTKRFALELGTVYGLSDYGVPTGFLVSSAPDKAASAGPALPGWRVRIVDEDDFDKAPGEVGEILVRSDNVWDTTSGYYGMAEKSMHALRNNWFHSGDLGYLDEDGYLFFAGRQKDAMRRRGENISAFEVEQIIAGHPAIADAAAYPLRSETSEDEIAVSITLSDGMTLSPEELIAFCQKNMAYYMIPRFVNFEAEMPRTLTQKVEKYKLQEKAERERATLWDREKAGIKIAR